MRVGQRARSDPHRSIPQQAGHRTTHFDRQPRTARLDLDANTVTTGESTVWSQNLIPATSDETLMQLIAYDLTDKEQFAAGWIGSKRTLLIRPTTAQVLAEGGYASKDGFETDLTKTARIVTDE